MNFNQAETLRDQLSNDCLRLKDMKPKSGQIKYNALIKAHDKRIEELCEELDNLKDAFKMFKLNTLSTIEQTNLEPRKTKCVTSPFSIYLMQK